MTMGQRIQQIRLELGLSQEEFGEKLGTTRQTVSRWELDQSYPELTKIVLISKLFSVTTDSTNGCFHHIRQAAKADFSPLKRAIAGNMRLPSAKLQE